MFELKKKKVAVFGLGKSGTAVCEKLKSLGVDFFVSAIEHGGHTLKDLENTDLIIVSPGIHLDIPVLEEAKKRKIPILSEIELAFQLLKKPIIAVTGTNGKTTTTTLIGEMLKAGGKNVAVAGNIGVPLVSVDDSNLDYIVAEISSYQLEAIHDFKPWIGLILNIQEDHLERHGSMKEYIKQKARIFENQTSSDYLIYNADDPLVVEMVKPAKSKKLPFTKQEKIEKLHIPGQHNVENALAAKKAAELCGIGANVIKVVLETFPGVEHRIELVKEIKGVKFYNDSKATNPDSTIVALKSFPNKNIILILGGKDKGTNLKPLCAMVRQQVKQVVLIGEATERFQQNGFAEAVLAQNLEQAVNRAYQLAQAGDIVLLSPACASFDQFKNFEERGKLFKQYVQNIKD